MIFDISNPSDPYTPETDRPDLAAVVCMALGDGQYALHDMDGEERCPFFMFGDDPVEWFENEFGYDLQDAMTDPKLADVFDSVLLCDAADRQSYYDALKYIDDEEKREAFRAEWLEKRRSSMNNIGKRAMQWAKSLREKNAPEPDDAPRQVLVGR